MTITASFRRTGGTAVAGTVTVLGMHRDSAEVVLRVWVGESCTEARSSMPGTTGNECGPGANGASFSPARANLATLTVPRAHHVSVTMDTSPFRRAGSSRPAKRAIALSEN